MLEVESVRVIPAVPEQGTSWWLVGGHYRGSRLVAKRLSASDPHNPPDLPDLSHAWGDDWQPSRYWTPTLVWARDGWQAEELAREACQRCGRVHTDDAVRALAEKVDPNAELTWLQMQAFWCAQASNVAAELAVIR